VGILKTDNGKSSRPILLKRIADEAHSVDQVGKVEGVAEKVNDV
jgi:hypothetical protein